jgi:hypothetical protein
MKLVYVAGPYRAKSPWEIELNIRKAEEYGLDVAKLGAVPLIPHTMYRFYQGQLPDAFWLGGTKQLLRVCHAALFIPGWENSSGSKDEFAECNIDPKIPYFYNLRELANWLYLPENR